MPRRRRRRRRRESRGRTQRGNNNAYCQANEISFYDWSDARAASDFEAFTAHVIGLHRSHAVLRRTSFFDGGGDPPDVAWLDPRGQAMTSGAWNDPTNHFIAFLLSGDETDDPEDDLLVVLERAAFTVPGSAGSATRCCSTRRSPTPGRPRTRASIRARRSTWRPRPCLSPPRRGRDRARPIALLGKQAAHEAPPRSGVNRYTGRRRAVPCVSSSGAPASVVVAPAADRVADHPEDLEDQPDDDAEDADAAEDAKVRIQGGDDEQEDAEDDHVR